MNARFRALFTSEVGAIEASQTLTLVARRRVASRAPRVRELRVREYRVKRVIDFVLATGALVVSAPVWLAIAAAIKLEDRGPVFYVQSRWGLRQQSFRAYKFRSMIVDADKKFGAVQAGRNDPRFTRVGRLLRGTSLDELPQLLNIWRGEMSWVGSGGAPRSTSGSRTRSRTSRTTPFRGSTSAAACGRG